MDERHNQLVVSERQLDRAIQLFLDETDYYSSGTLAGAAEEILGKLLLKAGKEHALDNAISVLLKMLSATEVDALSEKPTQSPSGRISDVLNFYRNWLKHYQEDDFELYIDAEEAASELIDRAVSNFFQLTSRETQQMRRFLEYQRNRYK
jgi:hypothetical protein